MPAEPHEGLVEIVHLEHHPQVAQRVHGGVAVIGDDLRLEEAREFKPAVAVGRPHHGDLDSLVAEAGDPARPLPLDGGPSFKFEPEFGEEGDRRRQIRHDDADVVQPGSHSVSLQRCPGRASGSVVPGGGVSR